MLLFLGNQTDLAFSDLELRLPQRLLQLRV